MILSQSEMWSDWQQAQRKERTKGCVRTYQSFSSLAGSSTNMDEESSRNPTIQAHSRWMLILLTKERARPKDVSFPDDLATQRRIANSTKEEARATRMEKVRVHLTRTVPPSLKVSATTAARKATSGQTARSDWRKQRTRKFTPSGPRKPRRQQQWQPWKTRVRSTKRVGPTMTLTLLRHGSSVWKTTTCRQTQSSSRSTALARSTLVPGFFLLVVTTWGPRTCS